MGHEMEDVTEDLRRVEDLRAKRQGDAWLGKRVAAVKRYQHSRFERDYAGLLDSPRHGAAARFFLEDLYGPNDFGERDAQFGRVVPALNRFLPADFMRVVAALAQLHALSEDLDQQMAQTLTSEVIDDRSYRAAWQKVGRSADRERQLALLLQIGDSLDRYTRSPLLATTLKLMRRPAKAAGLSQLQLFLERGLAAFTSMRGAREFLDSVADNERRRIAELFGRLQNEKPGTRETLGRVIK